MVGPSVIQTLHTLVTGAVEYLNYTKGELQATDDIGT